jgi:uncharacterized protein
VPPVERLEILDILRGFALFGVLLVNFTGALPKPISAVDHGTAGFIALFATDSFYPLFAMLFGMGLVLQFARWEASGAPALRLYLRRVGGLFLLGLAIWCLLVPWWILFQYSVSALALIPLRRARPRTLLLAAAGVYLVTIVAIPEFRRATGIRESPFAPREEMRANQEAMNQLSKEGPYPELVVARGRSIAMFLTHRRWYLSLGFQPLALLLLGAAIAKSCVMEHLQHYRPRLRQIVVWGGLFGLGAKLFELWRSTMDVDFSGLVGRMLARVLDLGQYALAFAYAAVVCLLFLAAGPWRRRLAPLAAVGRTAISNIFLQFLIIGTLLYGIGFGLSGRIPALPYLGVTILIFACEIWLSGWWLERHRFGPLEWLWRTLTYWRLPVPGPA